MSRLGGGEGRIVCASRLVDIALRRRKRVARSESESESESEGGGALVRRPMSRGSLSVSADSIVASLRVGVRWLAASLGSMAALMLGFSLGSLHRRAVLGAGKGASRRAAWSYVEAPAHELKARFDQVSGTLYRLVHLRGASTATPAAPSRRRSGPRPSRRTLWTGRIASTSRRSHSTGRADPRDSSQHASSFAKASRSRTPSVAAA